MIGPGRASSGPVAGPDHAPQFRPAASIPGCRETADFLPSRPAWRPGGARHAGEAWERPERHSLGEVKQRTLVQFRASLPVLVVA